MTGKPRFLQNWFPRAVAVILVVSFATASALLAAHEAEFDIHAQGSTYNLTVQQSGDTGASSDVESTNLAICAAGSLCHVQIAVIGTTEGAAGVYVLTGSMRPDPGMSQDGQITDVVTPPPLPMRA